jgi:hypothetical protein
VITFININTNTKEGDVKKTRNFYPVILAIIVQILLINMSYALDCMKLRFREIDAQRMKLVLKNKCDTPVEMRDAIIQFHSNVNLSGTFWGRFKPLTKPIDRNYQSKQSDTGFIVTMMLTFPQGDDENQPVTVLPIDRRIVIKFVKTPTSVFSQGSFKTAYENQKEDGKIALKLPLKPDEQAGSVPKIELKGSAGNRVTILDATWSSTSLKENLPYGIYTMVASPLVVNGITYEGTIAPNPVTVKDANAVNVTVEYNKVEPTPGPTSWWKPKSSEPISWHIQYTGELNSNVDAMVYNIDLFDVPTATIDALKNQGRKVMCYFSAGSYENWREDAKDFPDSVLGRNLSGWPGERWLDIRSNVVLDIMKKRIALAAAKHCDAVDPDNVDGYSNNTGFDLTYQDGINYLTKLSQLAHEKGLAIGLKNNIEQISALSPIFDFAVNEECAKYNECEYLEGFTKKDKAVFWIEYNGDISLSEACNIASKYKLNLLIKNLDLDAWFQRCP